MSPSSPAIRRTVEAYLGRHPGERDAPAGLLATLDRPVDTTLRTALPGHITCSAVVIDRQGRVLHIRHRASGLVLTPGGHVDGGDDTLLGAVLREVQEETGIPASCLVGAAYMAFEVTKARIAAMPSAAASCGNAIGSLLVTQGGTPTIEADQPATSCPPKAPSPRFAPGTSGTAAAIRRTCAEQLGLGTAIGVMMASAAWSLRLPAAASSPSWRPSWPRPRPNSPGTSRR
jgi:hypothetical protein